MLWNVYVIEAGECRKLNSEPYDADMVSLAIEQLCDCESVMLIPCSKPSRSIDELYSSIRGNAWVDVQGEPAMRGDSAETEA